MFNKNEHALDVVCNNITAVLYIPNSLERMGFHFHRFNLLPRRTQELDCRDECRTKSFTRMGNQHIGCCFPHLRWLTVRGRCASFFSEIRHLPGDTGFPRHSYRSVRRRHSDIGINKQCRSIGFKGCCHTIKSRLASYRAGDSNSRLVTLVNH